MDQLKEHIKPIEPLIRKNKNLVYKGKKYPIDFSLIKKYSIFFYNHKEEFKLIEDIELNPDNDQISDESISAFISCCQNKSFDITESNVFSLHQLSIQYDVPGLKSLTTQFISKNKKTMIFQSILYKLKNQNSTFKIDLADEEEIISSNFFDFINDEQLLSLPIHVLYRIISNKKIQINSMNSTNQNQFIDFLFKCLDKYKRDASILFLNLDLENERIGLLSKLLANYSDTFDFNFINSKLLSKSSSFLLGEIKKLKIEFANKISEIEDENKKQREFYTSSQNELLNSNHLLEEKLVEIEKEHANQISMMQKEQKKQIAQMQSELNELKKKMQEEQKIQIAQMQSELNEQTRKLNKYINIKVSKIEINSDVEYLYPGSKMKLTASIEPIMAFISKVEWQIDQDEEIVEIVKKNERKLVLKGLKTSRKKVKVIAKSLDGSGVEATKEINIKNLSGTIKISLLPSNIIKGTITIKEEEGITLDRTKSKYVLNTNRSENLGVSGYESGSKLDELVKEVMFYKQKGSYYLHVLIVDNFDCSYEMVSDELKTDGYYYGFGYTGRIESIQLEAGQYKLEAWGAQGGSANETYHGGYGGYSTGIINLKSKETLFIAVGQSTNTTSGGYNGGGNGGFFANQNYISFGGGGASHIGMKSGNLSSFSSDYQSQLLIAASGGGGSNDGEGRQKKGNKPYFAAGGCGGGITGAVGKSSENELDRLGEGGTQTSGGKAGSGRQEHGSFGQGANCGKYPGCLGGGGGSGFYGGGCGGCAGPGAGGSGYINTTKLTDAFMYGYEVPTSSSTESKTFSTTNVSSEAISNYAKKGDGYVKISPI